MGDGVDGKSAKEAAMMKGWRVLAIVIVAAGQALASEAPSQLHALMEGLHAHRRVAMGYLRTHNVDLAMLELERLWERWQRERRGVPVGSDRVLEAALVETETTVRQALAAAQGGDAEKARLLLERASAPLAAWRRAHGVRLFASSGSTAIAPPTSTRTACERASSPRRRRCRLPLLAAIAKPPARFATNRNSAG